MTWNSRFFAHSIDRRLVSFINREFPLIPYTLFVVVGNVAGYGFCLFLHGVGSAVLAFVGAAFTLLFARLCRWRMLFPVLVGFSTICAVLLPDIQFSTEGNHYVATVIEDPRNRSPGGRDLALFVRPLFNQPRFARSPFEKSGTVHAPGGFAYCRTVHLPWKNSARLRQGDTFILRARLIPIPLPANPFSFAALLRRHGFIVQGRAESVSRPIRSARPRLSVIREKIFERINQHVPIGSREGVFMSMVLGYRDLTSRESFRAFQNTGLVHLLVVSGYHVTLIFSLILALVRHGLTRAFVTQPTIIRTTFIIAVIGALAFVALIGVDGASLRAAIAVVVVASVRLFERGKGMVHGMCAALLTLTIIWPGCFFEPGVQLTFAALTGIAYGLACTSPRRWVRALTVLIAPSIATLGITIIWFQSASIIGFVLNPLIAPAASVLFTIGGLLALTFFFSGIDPGGVLLHGILWLIGIFISFVGWAANLSWAVISLDEMNSTLIGIAVLAVSAIPLMRRLRRYFIEMGVCS